MSRRMGLAPLMVAFALLVPVVGHAAPSVADAVIPVAPAASAGTVLELGGKCPTVTEPWSQAHPVLTCSQVTCTTSPICKQVCGADYICALLPGGLSGHCIAH